MKFAQVVTPVPNRRTLSRSFVARFRTAAASVLAAGSFVTLTASSQEIYTTRIGDPQMIASIVANQDCPNWCWAASCEMLAASQGLHIPQQEFVRRVYGPTLPCLPTFGSFEPIRAALSGIYDLPDGSRVGLNGAYHYGVPTDVLGMLRSIQEGRPFIFAWQGHAWVAYGIKFFYPGPNSIQFTEIELIDPLSRLSQGLRPQFYSFVVGRDRFEEINGTFELFRVFLPGPNPPNAPNAPLGNPAGGAVVGGQGGIVGVPGPGGIEAAGGLGTNPPELIPGGGNFPDQGYPGSGAAMNPAGIQPTNLDYGNGDPNSSAVIDIDGDGNTDLDLNNIILLQGLSLRDPDYNPAADLNGDGYINELDLRLASYLAPSVPNLSSLQPIQDEVTPTWALSSTTNVASTMIDGSIVRAVAPAPGILLSAPSTPVAAPAEIQTATITNAIQAVKNGRKYIEDQKKANADVLAEIEKLQKEADALLANPALANQPKLRASLQAAKNRLKPAAEKATTAGKVYDEALAEKDKALASLQQAPTQTGAARSASYAKAFKEDETANTFTLLFADPMALDALVQKKLAAGEVGLVRESLK